jgi:ribonuclease R
LSKVLRTLGLSLPRNPGRSDLQNLLEDVEGQACELAVNLLVLRSFEQAEYSPIDMGHYALASRQYCHFTSPIRRYADLLVHRVLESRLNGGAADDITKGELAQIGKHITFTEQRAEDAENELKTVLILQMLSGHLGDEMDCVVTGLTNFGMFVQCRKFGIEGLIRLEELGPDKWKFDRKGYCITGLNSGYCLRLGQKIRAKIISVNVPARQLNLVPAEPLISKSSTRKGKSGKIRPRKRRAGKKY